MAIKANLFIDQGATYVTTLKLTDSEGLPINLTGYTAAAQVRKHFSSSNAVSFDTSLLPETGSLVLELAANTTANMLAGRYVYDVELTDLSNRISRVVEGIVTVNPNVTR